MIRMRVTYIYIYTYSSRLLLHRSENQPHLISILPTLFHVYRWGWMKSVNQDGERVWCCTTIIIIIISSSSSNSSSCINEKQYNQDTITKSWRLHGTCPLKLSENSWMHAIHRWDRSVGCTECVFWHLLGKMRWFSRGDNGSCALIRGDDLTN